MEPQDQIVNALMAATTQIPMSPPAFEAPDFPGMLPIPTTPPTTPPGGGTGGSTPPNPAAGSPFASSGAALIESGQDIANLLSQRLPALADGETSMGIQGTLAAYQEAFENAQDSFMEIGNGDNGADPQAELTAGINGGAAGLNAIVTRTAIELGDDEAPNSRSGVAYAVDTIVTGADTAGGIVTAAFAAGAAVFESGAMRFVDEIAGATMGDPNAMGPGEMFAAAFGAAGVQVADGINTASDALTGMVPRAIADGLETGAQEFASAFVGGAGQVRDGIEGDGTSGPGFDPSMLTEALDPAALEGLAEQFDPAALEDLAGQLDPSALEDLAGQLDPSALEDLAGEFDPSALEDLAGQLDPSALEELGNEFDPNTAPGADELMAGFDSVSSGITSIPAMIEAAVMQFPAP